MMTSLLVSRYDATIRQCKPPRCSVDTILGWSLTTVNMQEKFNLYQYNHVLSLSWKIEILKTSYFHSLTETLEWSIVFWLVNHSNCLNGQWLVSQSLILRPTRDRLLARAFVFGNCLSLIPTPRSAKPSTSSATAGPDSPRQTSTTWRRGWLISCM